MVLLSLGSSKRLSSDWLSVESVEFYKITDLIPHHALSK